MARDDDQQPDDLTDQTDPTEKPEQSEGQVSEAGGALNGDETDLGGADAVPDKTSGSAVGSDDKD